MCSFDETHYLLLKQGERNNDKENHIGIALRLVTADVIV